MSRMTVPDQRAEQMMTITYIREGPMPKCKHCGRRLDHYIPGMRDEDHAHDGCAGRAAAKSVMKKVMAMDDLETKPSTGWSNFTFFRCCPATNFKASVEACEDGEAVEMPCAMCGAPVLVCMNQQLAIAKNPAIKVLGYGCADKLRSGASPKP